MVKYFNSEIISNESVPPEARFVTSISLSKKTYVRIDIILSNLPEYYGSRGQVVDAAIAAFVEKVKKETKKNG